MKWKLGLYRGYIGDIQRGVAFWFPADVFGEVWFAPGVQEELSLLAGCFELDEVQSKLLFWVGGLGFRV